MDKEILKIQLNALSDYVYKRIDGWKNQCLYWETIDELTKYLDKYDTINSLMDRLVIEYKFYNTLAKFPMFSHNEKHYILLAYKHFMDILNGQQRKTNCI